MDCRSVAQIEDFLLDRVAHYARLSPREIDPDSPFSSFGMGSREAVLMSGDLADWLQREVSPTLAWEYPNITQMASHLASAQP